jgi:hypothetical protein
MPGPVSKAVSISRTRLIRRYSFSSSIDVEELWNGYSASVFQVVYHELRARIESVQSRSRLAQRLDVLP